MSGMNEFLAQYYGTNGATEVEKTAGADAEQEKVAMFAKLAKDNGIDLSTLSDAQVEKLFHDTFSKTAGELPPQFQKKDEGEKKDDKDDEEKKAAAEAAAKQEEEKKAAADKELQTKQAEQADWMGRIMAHAYVNEMRKIAADAETKTAATQGAGTNSAQTTETKTASIREKLLKLAEKDEKPEEKKDEKKDGDDKGKSLPPWMKDKEASASLEEAAVQHALAIVQHFNKEAAAKNEQQFDVKVAADRLAAVHTLGMRDSEKVASAKSVEGAVEIRALEYLEAAGYPVTWPAA